MRQTRRRFLTATAGAGTVLVAGCTGNGGSDGNGNGNSDGSGGTAMGAFRLLISDQPADIGDFDSLEVTLSKARVFRASDDEDEDDEAEETDESDGDDSEGTETPEGTETSEPTETPEGTETDEDEDDDDEDDDEDGGFTELDLDGATVDLTEVVGDKAISVLEGELEAGTYSKIELHASDVAGVVDGDEVEVKLPSEKLQITKTFEVEEDGEVSFVFDINVVKRGPNNGYILQPVISESGVAGKDVDVEEVDDDDDEDDEDDEEDGTETAEPTETPEATEEPESAGNESA